MPLPPDHDRRDGSFDDLHMDNVIRLSDDLDPTIRGALEHAYVREVDLDVAARHLWAVDRAAGRGLDPADTPHGRRRLRRATVAAVAGVMLLSSSGAAVAASAAAVPGDVLYMVKRSTERAQLLLSASAAREAQLRLSFGAERFREAAEVAETKPEVVPDLLDQGVSDLRSAERIGGAAIAADVVAVRYEVTSQHLPVIAAAVGGDVQTATEIALGDAVGGPTAVAIDPTVDPGTATDVASSTDEAQVAEEAKEGNERTGDGRSGDVAGDSPSPSDSPAPAETTTPSQSETVTEAPESAVADSSPTASPEPSDSPSETTTEASEEPDPAPDPSFDDVDREPEPDAEPALASSPAPTPAESEAEAEGGPGWLDDGW